jgi:hypothetical protein
MARKRDKTKELNTEKTKNTVFVTLPSGEVITNTLLHELYVKQQMSTVEIAKHLNMTISSGAPNAPQIQRWLRKANIPQRSHSQSQQISLKKGVSVPNMKGKHHSSASRDALSIKLAKLYKDKTPEEKELQVKQLREFWTSDKREEALHKRGMGLRRARELGTELELAIVAMLMQNGVPCKLHAKMSPTSQHEYDIIAGNNIAIECDGVRHFEADKWMSNTILKLSKIISDDMTKDDYTVKQNYWMVRVLIGKKLSHYKVKELLKRILTVVRYAQQTDISKVSKRDRRVVIDTGLIFYEASCYGKDYKAAMALLAGAG